MYSDAVEKTEKSNVLVHFNVNFLMHIYAMQMFSVRVKPEQ